MCVQYMDQPMVMYLHGFGKLVLPDINKRYQLGERLERAEAGAIG